MSVRKKKKKKKQKKRSRLASDSFTNVWSSWGGAIQEEITSIVAIDHS